MAVIKAKPEVFVDEYLFPLVERQLITPLLVTRVSGEKFVGAQNDTVNFKLGGLRTNARRQEFRTRSLPIVLDDIQGGESIPVFLNTHTYSATGLTLEHLTLDEVNFTTEVLAPQTRAIAEQLEADVAFAFSQIVFKHTLDFEEGVTDPYDFAIDANAQLDAYDVPDDGSRFWLVGTKVWAAIAKSPRVSTHELAGPDRLKRALDRAEVAEVGGLRIVKSRAIDPNFSVVMHKSLMVLANVAPVVPSGAVTGRRYNDNGWDMTWIQDYDTNYQRDRSVVQTFTGITPIYDERKMGNGKDRHDLAGTNHTVRAVKVNFIPAAA